MEATNAGGMGQNLPLSYFS